jgi:hypothetical protein
MDDPNEDEKRMRHWQAVLLRGTRYWPEVFRRSLEVVSPSGDPDRDGALGIVLFGGSGSQLLSLLRQTMANGVKGSKVRHYLLEELDERGWRFRIHGREVHVLRQGREESSTADAAELTR